MPTINLIKQIGNDFMKLTNQEDIYKINLSKAEYLTHQMFNIYKKVIESDDEESKFLIKLYLKEMLYLKGVRIRENQNKICPKLNHLWN